MLVTLPSLHGHTLRAPRGGPVGVARAVIVELRVFVRAEAIRAEAIRAEVGQARMVRTPQPLPTVARAQVKAPAAVALAFKFRVRRLSASRVTRRLLGAAAFAVAARLGESGMSRRWRRGGVAEGEQAAHRRKRALDLAGLDN